MHPAAKQGRTTTAARAPVCDRRTVTVRALTAQQPAAPPEKTRACVRRAIYSNYSTVPPVSGAQPRSGQVRSGYARSFVPHAGGASRTAAHGMCRRPDACVPPAHLTLASTMPNCHAIKALLPAVVLPRHDDEVNRARVRAAPDRQPTTGGAELCRFINLTRPCVGCSARQTFFCLLGRGFN